MRIRAALLSGLLTLSAAVGVAAPAAAQLRVDDLVVTGGVALEGYQGNLAAVTVPVVDSTDRASAAVGEFGARGRIYLFERDSRVLRFDFDAGMRQFAAAGFEVRDYAPREWVGSVDLRYRHDLGRIGLLAARVGARGRDVTDRPPMPLFLHPGYLNAVAELGLRTNAIDGFRYDVTLRAERADYSELENLPQLDLLDLERFGIQVGAEWGDQSIFRIYGGFRASEYPEQGTFDPEDPFRRDRTVSAGAEWTWPGSIFAQFGLEGTLNRSNSSRPEYDALSARVIVSAGLPGQLGLNFYALLTGKSYLNETDFARLVPGEEADDASQAYVELTRPVAPALDGAIRFGWTRAETDIGDSYYQRYGMTFLLHYRPGSR